MPLYTSMVAEGVREAGLRPIVLASRHLSLPAFSISWAVYRWLPVEHWPPPPGSPIVPAWRQAISWLGCAVIIVVAVLALRPKIVHFQHPIHPRLDHLLLRALAYFVPVVWTAHDILPHDHSTNAHARACRLYSASNLVLVHSEPAAQELAKLAGVFGLVIRHPVRRLNAVPDRGSARRQLGLHPHNRLAVAVGFIRSYKGYNLIADTWFLLGDNAPDLLILGELVDESERKVIQRLQCHPRADVRANYASDEDVIAAMAAADIILLPHQRGSDSGSLHMARAVGTPVLSSDMAQLAAVVVTTAAGWVLPREPAQWAQALLGDLPRPPDPPPLPAEIGNEHMNAYRMARQYWLRR